MGYSKQTNVNENDIKNLLPEFLLNSETYSLVITDLEGYYIFVNNIFRKNFSFISDDFIGLHSFVTIYPEDHPICLQAVEECFANPEKIVKVQLRKPETNQNYFYWTQWEFSVFKDQNQQPIGILCLGSDITETKRHFTQIEQQEYMLRAIYQSTSEASTFVDRNFIIRYNNQVAKQITKQVFGKEAQAGESSLDYFLPEYQTEFREIYEKALTGISTTLERTDGINWWQLAIYPVYDKQNNIIGLANNVQNITERKQKENAILQQNEALRAIAWQQSHELRRPVANILGLCALFENYDNETPEMQKKYLSFMIQSTEELDTIIHKIVLKANENEYPNNE